MGIGSFVLGGLVGVGAGYWFWGKPKIAVVRLPATAVTPSAMLAYRPSGATLAEKKLALGLPNVKMPPPGTLRAPTGAFNYGGASAEVGSEDSWQVAEQQREAVSAVYQASLSAVPMQNQQTANVVVGTFAPISDAMLVSRNKMQVPYESFFSNVPSFAEMRRQVDASVLEANSAIARAGHAPIVSARNGVGSSSLPLYQFMSMNGVSSGSFDRMQASILGTDLGPFFEMGDPFANGARILGRWHPSMHTWINAYIAEAVVRLHKIGR